MPEIWFYHLGIKIQHLSRVAVTIFGIPIYWYGIIIGLGFFSGYVLVKKEAIRTNQDPELYTDFIMYALIFGLIGARIYYVLFSWDTYKDDLLSMFATREGGLAIYGGIIAVAIFAIFYAKKKNVDFGLLADTCALPLISGQIIGRWGNFINREAFGGYTESFFALRYLKDKVDYIPHSIMDKIVTINGAEYIQVHPTFLYESLWNLGLFILLTIYKKNKAFDGEIFTLYLLGYGIGRFWIEGLRTDQLLLFSTNIAVSQALSLLLVFVAIIILFSKRLLKK